MSNKIKRYAYHNGKLFECDAVPPGIRAYVKAYDYDALIAENEALRKDAERYRFLRDTDSVSDELADAVNMISSYWSKPDEVDAAVDLAMEMIDD